MSNWVRLGHYDEMNRNRWFDRESARLDGVVVRSVRPGPASPPLPLPSTWCMVVVPSGAARQGASPAPGAGGDGVRAVAHARGLGVLGRGALRAHRRALRGLQRALLRHSPPGQVTTPARAAHRAIPGRQAGQGGTHSPHLPRSGPAL